jgi:hypothetical protein|tara:strand:+ start:365 stop:484 length:120 start_codon:yes stop_codon:yes gene_type:complete
VRAVPWHDRVLAGHPARLLFPLAGRALKAALVFHVVEAP